MEDGRREVEDTASAPRPSPPGEEREKIRLRPETSSVNHQRTDGVAFQFVAAGEEAEFDQEGDFEDVGAKALNEGGGGGGGAAGGQEVVNEQDTAAGFEGVHVDGDGGGAVFKGVFLFVGLVGKLALFADRDQAGLELDGGGGGDDEAAGVDARGGVHGAGLQSVGQQINAAGEKARIGQDGGDVLELDAGFGEVGDVADGAFDVGDSGSGHEFFGGN